MSEVSFKHIKEEVNIFNPTFPIFPITSKRSLVVRSDLESPLFPLMLIVLYVTTADISEGGLLCEMRLAARVAFLLTESCS